MPNWKKVLLAEAQDKGMCGDYLGPLSLCDDKITAIGLYMSNPVWAIAHNYPTLQVLRDEFALYSSEGLFIDRSMSGELLNEHMCYVFHACSGEIRTGLNVGDAVIPDLHLAHGCHMKVISEGAPVQIDIHVYGEDNVVETEGTATFRIHRHDTD